MSPLTTSASSGRKPDTPLWPALAAALGVLVLSGGLYAFSRPTEAEERLSALETRLKALQASARAPGDTEAFPAGSVCGGKLYPGYKDQIGLALGSGGLELATFEVGEPVSTQGRTPLQAYPVTLKATGAYDAAITGLNGLSKFRPTLFVDTVALRNKTDLVELELKGRVFCR